MISKNLSLIVLLAIIVVTIPLAQAVEPTTISTKLKSGEEIDLEWDDKDRMVRVWTMVSNFDTNDGYFNINIINPDGEIVAQKKVEVYTTSNNEIINFGSFVTYKVDQVDVCADELEEEVNYCKNVYEGEYEIQVATKDGTVTASHKFNIIDTRGT